LAGVAVRVLDHPELGRTRTREDGMFDLAVSGGGTLTLVYEKDGWLPADRKVSTRWQEFAHADDVALVGLDSAATTVAFGPGAPEAQVARATVATDADGPRQATLVFDAGTEAALEMPDGTLRPAGSLTIRATEYTVGENGRAAMPAELPAMSGYTYAVELSADEAMAAGAPHVRFSKPVAFYLDNFLSFPVGLAVPAGWYDRERAVWVPTDDGRVIRITAVSGGRAEVDANGDGAPEGAAALAAMGIDDAERARLAEMYAPGKTLWRVETDHFSWIDLNYPRGAKDARNPRMRRPRVSRPGDDPCLRGGSIIECEGRVLGERIPLVGTELTLGYRSDRAPGRIAGRAAEIPVSGPDLPASLRAIVLQVRVAGRSFTDTLPPTPNQTHTFVWDGRDAYGRTLQGQHAAEVRIGYVYPTYYLVPASAARSFGLSCQPAAAGDYYQTCQIPATMSSRARQEETRWQSSVVSLGATGDWDARAQALGGWTLDVHHAYDPVGRVLYGGDGSRRSAASQTHVLETVAGGPTPAPGTPPLVPSGMVMAPDGSVYVASYATHQVWRWHRDGRFTLVAGNGGYGCGGDGGPATAANLAFPDGVALGPDGSLYIEDSSNDRIRRVAPDGTISTFAGAGQCDEPSFVPASARAAGAAAGADTVFPKRRARVPVEETDGARVASAALLALGDGGPADQALLSSPYGVDVAKDGSVYIADSGHNRIRRVTPDGIITTVAGTGTYGFSGDGGAATLARLAGAWGVTIGPDGSLYVSDTGNERVRRVGVDGVIATVAGNGGYGFSGDGGPAVQARMRTPADRLAFGADGSVYIPDSDNGRIRRVTPDGVISTVAGSDAFCSASTLDCGDGGPATAAAMGYMYDLMTGPDGELYIADTGAGRLRRLRPAVPGLTGSEIAVASEDGLSLHVFDAAGRHLRTVSARTETVGYAFGYDAAGRLATVTDWSGRVTRIERDPAGTPTAVVGPFGDRTALETDAAGWLSRVENPAGEATLLTHTPDGLLLRLENPAGRVHAFEYDALGRLTRDDDGAGGFQTLVQADSADSEGVARLTAEGRSSRFVTETLPTGNRVRATYDAAGLATRTVRETAERVTTTLPDGTSLRQEMGPDPRFGMQAPLVRASTLVTPAGRRLSTTASRQIFVSGGRTLLVTERTGLNGRESTLVHNLPGRLLTRTSAEGRVASVRLDSLDRVVEVSAAGMAPTAYTYDAEGRLAG
ncbi:MAG TPA: hypothetical protein VHG91_14535, partial [Longimicrobium sp.]|nr:hypothetical protein [Longimicrobium sp.]